LDPRIELRFAANVDGSEIAAALQGLASGRNAGGHCLQDLHHPGDHGQRRGRRAWLRGALGDGADAHLAAVSAAPEVAQKFGVAAERVFAFRDWVGGRFSVWSAVGLSCAVGLGWEAWSGFLQGAAAMDRHFLEAPLEANARCSWRWPRSTIEMGWGGAFGP
jgi:glucose-6-phosphate isomerase